MPGILIQTMNIFFSYLMRPVSSRYFKLIEDYLNYFLCGILGVWHEEKKHNIRTTWLSAILNSVNFCGCGFLGHKQANTNDPWGTELFANLINNNFATLFSYNVVALGRITSVPRCRKYVFMHAPLENSGCCFVVPLALLGFIWNTWNMLRKVCSHGLGSKPFGYFWMR